jgi:hypothetical protein
VELQLAIRPRAQNDIPFTDALGGRIPAFWLPARRSDCSGWPRRRTSPRGKCEADLSF